MHAQLNTTKPEKNSFTCEHMNETGGHYGKWNEPDTERQIPHVHFGFSKFDHHSTS